MHFNAVLLHDSLPAATAHGLTIVPTFSFVLNFFNSLGIILPRVIIIIIIIIIMVDHSSE